MEGKESMKRFFDQLNDEQKEKFKNCSNMDEIMKLANEENYDLSEEQLDFLAGGGCPCDNTHGCNPLCRDEDCPHECHGVSGYMDR